MFRTLAMRLTAAYVFAAIVLVVIVLAAFTAFALSIFGLGAREASDAVARQASEEVRLEVGRYGSFAAAAPAIARHLARPGMRIVVMGPARNGRGHFLAMSGGEGEGKAPYVSTPPPSPPDGRHEPFSHDGSPVGAGGQGDPGGPGGPGGPPPAGPAEGPWGGPARMPAYPFFLNTVLHLEPQHVAVPGGVIAILPDPAPLLRTINSFWLAMLPIGLFVIAAAWFLGRAIAGQALRPLIETTASLRRFGDGDFTPRAIVTVDRNEIGELVEAYNAAAAQVSAAFAERRAAEEQMRQFIADAGHELRTPLTVIMGFIDVLRRRALHEPATSTKIYDTMLGESRRMKSLIERLIVLARLENVNARELETVDLGDIARQVLAALGGLEPRPPVTLQAMPGVLVRGYENELHEALSNLVENALKYAPGSPVDVRIRTEGEMALVDVVDRGPGIPHDEQPHVFARFYRGRDRGESEGFGLGLAIAKRAVERAGGNLALYSVSGEGSRFTIRIPRVSRGEAAALAV